MTLRLELAIKGDLSRFLAEEHARLESAVTRAVSGAAQKLKLSLRAETAQRLGTRLGNAWRSKVYPEGQASAGAAGLVFTKAPKLIRAFSEGATIRSKNGTFLAIPTEAAPKRGVGRKRISPSTFPEAALGKLRFVYRRGAPSLLVVDNLRQSQSKNPERAGRFRKASASALRTGRGLATVVMFILVPIVRLRKVLDIERHVLPVQSALAGDIARELQFLASTEAGAI